MTVDHDDDNFTDDEGDSAGQAEALPSNTKDSNQRQLEMRRRLEDRLERRRLRDELGCDDLWELDF
ncbi:PA3496 family putative envelope integrity protein [Gilvimarinus algae]|uniref:Uncharacterized protein n=1 Tax=Gilvimarinus algae TaxID=3058037 RepID=A0ABT8THI2_9GAMM|nr:hypothetical protein [Gilvimarinus sp. SDUM040014]MDO3383555.1 hypothetical protein [Gilvimarinus sp. SDUM040014]